jgi:hypothetical protein
MAQVATNYSQYLGKVVGNGHCVALVQVCSPVGHTSNWRRGALARGGHHPDGSVIATFGINGRYENKTDGSSHVAILLGEQTDGLLVQDQWVGQPCHHRLIRFRNGEGTAVNDGDSYYLVEKA